MQNEKFDKEEIEKAITQFLEFGDEAMGCCHLGYFGGNGWAARVLRYHLEQMKNSEHINLIARGKN